MSQQENHDNESKKKGFFEGSSFIIPIFLSVLFLKMGGFGGVISAIFINISFFGCANFLKNRDNPLNKILIYIISTIFSIISVLILLLIIDLFNGKL